MKFRPAPALAGMLLAATCPALDLRPEIECVLDSAECSLDLRFSSFEDPGLRFRAGLAAARGVRVRLLLSPRRRANRLAFESLKAGGMELRWDAESPCCYAVADQSCLVQGRLDGTAECLDRPGTAQAFDDPAAAAGLNSAFEAAWAASPEAIDEGILLNDELESLPDPRETEPRLQMKRRRN